MKAFTKQEEVMEDELIIKLLIKRKEKGIDILVNQYRGLITSIVRKNLGQLSNYEEECVNDIFLSIWNNIDKFDKNKNSFKNWIGVISKYKAIDYKRKYTPNFDTVSIEDYDFISDETQLTDEISDELDSMLSCLNKSDKDLFINHYIKGEKLEEIASKNKLNISNLYNRLSRGRKKIKQNIINRSIKI